MAVRVTVAPARAGFGAAASVVEVAAALVRWTVALLLLARKKCATPW